METLRLEVQVNSRAWTHVS